MRVRVLAIIAATTLLPVLLAAPASAPAAAQNGRPAAPQHRPVLILGKITFHGKPVRGATVKLYADPLPSALHKIKVNHKVPDALIGKTVTGPEGGYAIPVTAAALKVMKARAVRGIVNLHVLAFTHKNGTVFWFPRKVSLHKLAAGAAVPSLATPEVVNLTLADNEPATSAALQKLEGINPAHPSYDWGACGVRYPMYRSQPYWVVVGATYSNMKHAGMQFGYEHGTSTVMGVGFSSSFMGSIDPGNNPLGLTFTQTSTASWNNTITEPYPPHSGIRNDAYSTRFVYGEFITTCGGITVQPVDFADGTRDVQVPGFGSDNRHCAPHQPAPGPVVISGGTSTDYSQGVAISALIGINLSSETDRSSSSTLAYTFPKGGYLCGTTGNAGSMARNNTLYAGKWHGSHP